MSDEEQDAEGRSTVLTRVRCLECGHAYAKPAAGGTMSQNPGCPSCGYLGWIPAAVEVTAPQPRRSAADPQRCRADRRR